MIIKGREMMEKSDRRCDWDVEGEGGATGG